MGLKMMKQVNISLDKLILDSDNARMHPDKNKKAIRASLEQFGQVEPLIVQKNSNIVIGGNGRLEVMRDLGYLTADIVYVDLSDTERKALGVALNRTSDLAEWNSEQLGNLVHEIKYTDDENINIDDMIASISVSSKEMDKLLAASSYENPDLKNEDEQDFEQAEKRAKVGDIWKLGKHKLACGDLIDMLPKLLKDKKYDLLVTDPPYGVSYASKNKKLNNFDKRNRIQTEIENDHKKPEEMYGLWKTWFKNIRPYSKPGSCYYITGPQGGDSLLLLQSLKEADFILKHILIWVKNKIVLGYCDYNYKHEPILYGWTKGTHNFYGKGGESSVWEVDKPQKSKMHPTMKPVELFARAIKNSSKQGQMVLDPFLGSGTTLIACEQLNRICCGIELSPDYCDIIINRWERLTNEKAKRG